MYTYKHLVYDLCFKKQCDNSVISQTWKQCVQNVVATKLTGPGINTCFVTPLLGLFLASRGEKYKQDRSKFTIYTMNT